MTCFGPADGPLAVFALPLFEEANRTRAVAFGTMRLLAARGIGAALPELPGQGESLVPTEDVTLARIRAAYAAAVRSLLGRGRACFAVAIRSGALVDRDAPLRGRWHLAPQDGPALLRELTRVKQVEFGRERRLGERWWLRPGAADGTPALVAGNLLCPDLMTELASDRAADGTARPRLVRFASDPGGADRRLAGIAPWRRLEADGDLALEQTLAADIAEWIARCADR